MVLPVAADTAVVSRTRLGTPLLSLLSLALAPTVGAALQSDLPLSQPPTAIGSGVRIAVAPGLEASSTRASGVLYSAELGVRTPTHGLSAGSSSYSLTGAAVLSADLGVGAAPLVVTLEPRIVDASGGDTARILGLGLDAGGPPQVLVGGQPAGVIASSASEISFLMPPLVDQNGNPVGPFDVRVQAGAAPSEANALGFAGPTYVQTRTAQLGGTFDLSHAGPANTVGFPAWGLPIPGVVIPFPGFEGALALPNLFLLLPPENLDGAGYANKSFPLPDDPTLAGQTLQFQSVVFESFLPQVASFTNVVTVELLP